MPSAGSSPRTTRRERDGADDAPDRLSLTRLTKELHLLRLGIGAQPLPARSTMNPPSIDESACCNQLLGELLAG
jgi:hypothetical protein